MVTHILLPVDGSDPSTKALEYAAENYDGERFTIIHVANPTDNLYGGLEGGYGTSDLFDRAVENGEEICDEARERLRNAGVPESTEIETTVEVGNPARQIIEYATENDVDQIVIGSHGRSGVSRILLGSVAEKVLRRAPMPVNIIR